jgi:Bacterial extracellular solute-binding protein
MVFWYNKELCLKVGVDPKKIKYGDDFVEAAKKMSSRRNSSGGSGRKRQVAAPFLSRAAYDAHPG